MKQILVVFFLALATACAQNDPFTIERNPDWMGYIVVGVIVLVLFSKDLSKIIRHIFNKNRT
jgi:hypothetical protein